jgi:hypothetical protein
MSLKDKLQSCTALFSISSPPKYRAKANGYGILKSVQDHSFTNVLKFSHFCTLGPVGPISQRRPIMSQTTEDILTQKIRDQEQQIAQLTQLLCAAEHENAARVTGHLRANGTILLHLGQDIDTYVQTLQNGTITANPRDLIAQTYSLQAAQISHDLKAQIRNAANHGETKWPS